MNLWDENQKPQSSRHSFYCLLYLLEIELFLNVFSLKFTFGCSRRTSRTQKTFPKITLNFDLLEASFCLYAVRVRAKVRSLMCQQNVQQQYYNVKLRAEVPFAIEKLYVIHSTQRQCLYFSPRRDTKCTYPAG